jgi:uncharacterized protein YcbX
VRSVARISAAAVKNTRLRHPASVELGPDGVVENRRFFLVDGAGNRLRTSLTAWPALVKARYDPLAERLALGFPDGTEIEEDAHGSGERLICQAGGRDVTVCVVEGAWGEQLSDLAGHDVRVVRSDAVGASLTEPVTLISDGSLARLARQAGHESVDARRFRMLFELAGCEPHEEDGWEGRLLRLGEAVVRVGGPVDRCAATTRDPETGERDLDTLRLIKDYRGQRDTDGAVLFGVYARVETPGVVCVGDPVELLTA